MLTADQMKTAGSFLQLLNQAVRQAEVDYDPQSGVITHKGLQIGTVLPPPPGGDGGYRFTDTVD